MQYALHVISTPATLWWSHDSALANKERHLGFISATTTEKYFYDQQIKH